ncbi:uncharacterized protein [Prorops nasuta]|uniref:uncharacterized protein n=1 Tax=Prorops nasuta TaxID=863751 RepID=UPI0034CDADEF
MAILEEIHNFNLSPLVNTTFSVEWSQNNMISVITANGVHIFELIPSPMSPQQTMKFARSFIHPSTVLPGHPFATDIEARITKMSREEVYCMFLEGSIIPKFTDLADITPTINRVSWSPQGLIESSKSLLAICTSSGAIELLHKVSKYWYSVCDLTSYLLKIVEDEVKLNIRNCVEKQLYFDTIISNVRKVVACTMVWSNLFITEKLSFAYLVTAYRSSDIIIWKIPKISCIDGVLNPEITCKISLNTDVKIKALCWLDVGIDKHLIIAGLFNGTIHGIIFKNENTNLKLVYKKIYYEHADRIEVTSLKICSQGKTNIKILAVKGPFLILLNISNRGSLNSVQHIKVGGFSVTGLTAIGKDKFLATTQNCDIFLINTNTNLKKRRLENNLVKTGVQYLGIAHSPNYLMFVNITSPNSMFDHLITREPSMINIFGLKGDSWDPLKILIEKEKHLKDLWDAVELVRIKAARSFNPAVELPLISQNLESLPMNELQMAMWISIINEICKKKKIIEKTAGNIIGEISEAQPLVFLHSTCIILNRLANQVSISKEQSICIKLLRMYLEVYLAGEDSEIDTYAAKCARAALSATKSIDLADVELCNLCSVPITELAWDSTQCPSGHKLPRCAATLLQITTVNYLTCTICGKIYHPCIDEIFEEARCIFCDLPPSYDNRIIDLKSSRLLMKNLSKPHTSNGASREHECEQQATKAPTSSSSQCEPYSVVFHDNEDESCKFTETWQQF